MKNENKTIIGVIAFAVLLLFWAITGPVAILSPGERGVEVSQGRVTGKIYSEGWHIYNSILNDIVQFDVKSQVNNEVVAAASQDLQDVQMELAIQYRLDPDSLAKVVEKIGHQKDVDTKIVEPAVQEVVKASTALFPVGNIIKDRNKVKETIDNLLTERLQPYGIVFEEVSIKNITFSTEFTKAIEEKQVAEQKKLQASFEADAEVLRAEGKAKAQTIEGEAIRLNPEILKLRAIEKWNGAYPQVVSDSSNLLFELN